MKFRIGDRVRCLIDESFPVVRGALGTVVELAPLPTVCVVEFDEDEDDSYPWLHMAEDELELVK